MDVPMIIIAIVVIAIIVLLPMGIYVLRLSHKCDDITETDIEANISREGIRVRIKTKK